MTKSVRREPRAFSCLCWAFCLQVYVSYDYGKSFKKISEKFSFGEGNSSEVAIAQFYHSPADNKRVRLAPSQVLCRAASVCSLH